jgi:hypothetical protein
MSWIDNQRNYPEIIESQEQGIIEEEEQISWNNRPKVGFIFEETLKEIKRKAWQKIKLNYLMEHPKLFSKILPTLLTKEIRKERQIHQTKEINLNKKSNGIGRHSKPRSAMRKQALAPVLEVGPFLTSV